MRALTLASFFLVTLVTACTITTKDGSSNTGGGSTASTVLSGSIPTSKLHPSFSAQDYGDGAGIHVYAAWLDDGGKWVTTSGGDVVTASDSGAAPVTLFVESGESDKVHYTTTLASAPGASTISIGLNRPAGQSSAPASTAVVGAPFTITTAVPKTMNHGDKLPIAIEPPPDPDVVGDGDSWQLTASGSCISDYVASTVKVSGSSESATLLDAQGRFVFDTSKLTQQGPSSSCDLTVMVKHMHYGQLDPAYGPATADLGLQYSDAPQKNGTVDTTCAVEGVQARAAHTTLTFP